MGKGFSSQRGDAFVLDHQHGLHDVTCEPAIITRRPRDTLIEKLFKNTQILGATK